MASAPSLVSYVISFGRGQWAESQSNPFSVGKEIGAYLQMTSDPNYLEMSNWQSVQNCSGFLKMRSA